MADLPGLEGLTLLEDALDEALESARANPGWAGVAPMPPRRKEIFASAPVEHDGGLLAPPR